MALKLIQQNEKRLAAAQGAYYFASGVWPLVNIRSFEKVTGPKIDDWLVKTVGLLVTVSGIVFLRSSLNSTKSDRVDSNVELLACGEALCLGGVSLVYSLKKQISKIYLLDALVEFGFAYSWIKELVIMERKKTGKKTPKGQRGVRTSL